jgi:hypothetical protein
MDRFLGEPTRINQRLDSKGNRRMGTKSLLIGAMLVLATLTACGDGISITFDDADGDEVNGSGTIEMETRQVGDFDEIILAGEGLVVVTVGPETSLSVTTDDNLLGYIETTVQGGVLEIATEQGIDIDPTESVRYEVSTPAVEKLMLTGAGDFELAAVTADRFAVVLSGAGDVRVGELTATDLQVDITGAGSVEVAGEVTSQTVNLPGAGSYEAAELKSSQAAVSTSGVGSATVWVTDELDARVTGVGSIDYYGSPSVSSSVTGIGSINGRGDA